MMFYDFHTHSFHSDGVLSPFELIRRAKVQGYAAVGITDHLGIGSLERVIREVTRDCALARKYWDILAIPGVELTHLPPESIDEVAREAKKLGAMIVVVHGECTSEPVAEGTNLAAVRSPYVDVLAHPGMITAEVAAIAASNLVFLELSARKGHMASNDHIAATALKENAYLIINSDAHDEGNLLTSEIIESILQKAGITEHRTKILEENPRLLIQKIKQSA